MVDFGARDDLTAESRTAAKASHPASGPRLPVENDAYAAMLERMLRAYARRVAEGDPEDLTRMLALRDRFDELVLDAVTGLRQNWGASWADVGRAAGMTRQSAFDRWNR